ncbi:MAG: pyridoxal 5'-phosphate synthase glutaminase subunit PdxT [Chloroflexi bacterium]|nr:pyridoxal 5'-phosphate synthase glutaminase subunit PdxT [Chloroflexota bacterium]
MRRIGVLALQGAFAEHISVLQRLGVEAVPVRLPGELEELEGLIIPGGESTTMSRLMTVFHLRDEIKRLAEDGLPMWGTCAGLILLAKEVDSLPDPLGVMDIGVRRNAFGRQVDSFETELPVLPLGKEPFPAVFIRAPQIDRLGSEVEVLARLTNGQVVAARENNLVATAFHPELTTDPRFHCYFLNMAKNSIKQIQQVLSPVGGEKEP